MARTDQNASGESLRSWFEMDTGALLPEELIRVGRDPFCDVAAHVDHWLAEGRPAWAAAGLIAAFIRVWEEGRGFEQAEPWIRLGEAVLAAGCSGVAAGALTVHLTVAGMLGPADLVRLSAGLPRLRLNAGRSESAPIRQFAAATEVHLQLMRGDLHAAQTVLSDAAHLATAEHRASMPSLFLAEGAMLAQALGASLGPRVHKLMADRVAHASGRSLPTHARLTRDAYRLLALARHGDAGEADRLAQALRSRAVPSDRRMHRSHMHYALGVADLVAGRAGAALVHARLAMEEGELSGSVAACLVPALLLAQCHFDQHLDQEGLALLDRFEPQWRSLGFDLHLRSAGLERARCLDRAGQAEAARRCRREAETVCPGAGSPLPLHRSPGWDQGARPQTRSREVVPARPPEGGLIEITTLGRFEVKVEGRALPERGWGGGRRATALLRTLVALGGSHVRAERLCDRLWPDSDGDQARQNLKVALWRLKRIADDGAGAPPWLHLQHGEVSIDSRWCVVDAYRFQSDIVGAGEDPGRLWSVLPNYSGDFLQDDGSVPVVALRDRLRQLFIRSTCLAVRGSLLSDLPLGDAQIGLLRRAVSMQPDHAAGYELLMAWHLRNRRAIDAILVFHHAEQELAGSRGATPGAELMRLHHLAVGQLAGVERWGEPVRPERLNAASEQLQPP